MTQSSAPPTGDRPRRRQEALPRDLRAGAQEGVGTDQGGRRGLFRDSARRDVQPGGGVGMREDDDRQADSSPGDADVRPYPLQRQQRRQLRLPRASGVPDLGAGGLPGPVELAESTPEGTLHRRGAGHRSQAADQAGGQVRSGVAAGGGGAASRPRRQLSPRVQRRPAAEDRGRQGPYPCGPRS